MKKQSLNGEWFLKRADWNIWIQGVVPGSVCQDLLNAGLIDDPFYRDNEDRVLEIFDHDYEYRKTFWVEREFLEEDRVFLFCAGLDTLAEIRINGSPVATTDNMHRRYRFDVKHMLLVGENEISIVLHSPVRFIREKNGRRPLWGAQDAMAGFPHIRKAHYMFGWDWGPKIPDMGIWRDISLLAYSSGRIKDVYVRQNHADGEVTLDIDLDFDIWSERSLDATVRVVSPQDEVFEAKVSGVSLTETVTLRIPKPALWWPNGYGDQSLYALQVMLTEEDVLLDSSALNIGLRTLTVKREPDHWGESFAFAVNGVTIFAMGANYIPEDNLLSRLSPERTERLIKDCVAANFNCLRVWGGGTYPPDYFFDLCDRYGIIVWQDFMFACAVYEMSGEFEENIRREVEDNVRRIRNHACLGLWCGNNEMEWGWEAWDFPKSAKLRTDYIKQFEIVMPEIVKKLDPETFYWPASPSSGGGFEDPNGERAGDAHYWEVWHGLKPFVDYRNHYFRFASEFGFQSFPCLKTVESFTKVEDRNIFSYVMEKHQKNGAGNGKILYYLSETFKYPTDFDSLLFVSQLLQAEAIKCGVEHFRRNRGRCMGATYWQLNDCWPVASWASIDYFGRWKALHYFARRFFAPILLSACEDGTKVSLHLTNETLHEVTGTVTWRLRGSDSNTLRQGTREVTVSSLSSIMCETLDFSAELDDVSKRQRTYLQYSFAIEGREASCGTVLFVPPKHFEFLAPNITHRVKVDSGQLKVILASDVFAKSVEVSVEGLDLVFSDNYFDLSGGELKEITADIGELPERVTSTIGGRIRVRSLFDTWEF